MIITNKKFKELLNLNTDIVTLISDRNGRKSSVVQSTLIEEWEKNNYKPLFVLLRTKSDEKINENWISEYNIKKYKEYKFKHKKLNNYITTIYAIIDEKEYVLCFNLFVSMSQKYKSSYYEGFETVRYIIWEECVPEKRLLQKIDYVKTLDEEIKRIFSIGSTVCRNYKPKYIFIGNDIESNVINPITYSFNLLDKLEVNKEITGNCKINDNNYSYVFYYFNFRGSIEHWLNIKDLNVDNKLKPTGEKLDLTFTLNDKIYNVYYDKTIQIIEDKSERIENSSLEKELLLLLDFFPEQELYQFVINYNNIYKRDELYNLFRLKNSNFNLIFNEYYKLIEFNNILTYQFVDKEEKQINNYNINEIEKMTAQEIVTNCQELFGFFKNYNIDNFMYSNILIKLYIEKIRILIGRIL